MNKISKLLRNQRGAGSIEYALVASLIAVAAMAGYHNLGAGVESSFNGIDENLEAKS
jgi:pilus assembly protein Flp/PilA